MRILPIGTQIANKPFVVTVQFRATDWSGNLAYVDDKGLSRLIPPGAVTPGASQVTFTHPGLAIGQHTVTITEPRHNVNITSNKFRVVKG